MADTQNLFSIDGTLYAKNSRVVAGKKDPTKTYTFNSIVLELKTTRKMVRDGKESWSTYTEFPEFETAQGVNLDEFNIGDNISVRFVLSGREFKNSKGEKQIITKVKAIFIKFADIVAEPKSKDGKVTTGSKTDPKQLEIFQAPDPMDDDLNDFKDLPF